jgi:polyhydroxybutyrate depolymerase
VIRPSISVRATALAFAVVLLALVVACAPPTAPGPTVRPQPEDRGRIDEVAVAPSSGCGQDGGLAAGHSVLTVPFGGGQRSALVDVPASAVGDEPAPVLLSLHPFLATGAGWEAYSGLAAAALERGYVVITPTGSDPGPRWAVPGGLDTGVDDIAHLSRLLDEVEDQACIDRNREFAAGFSAGAAMSQALSCTLPWRMAAVAASGGANLTSPCPASPPTDVLILHGSADPIAPTSGSEVVFAPPVGLSIDTVVATNRGRADCDPTPSVEQVRPDVVAERSTGCAEDRRVEYWRLLGAGHTWAGSTAPLLEVVAGPTTTSIDANDVVLDFFDQTAG